MANIDEFNTDDREKCFINKSIRSLEKIFNNITTKTKSQSTQAVNCSISDVEVIQAYLDKKENEDEPIDSDDEYIPEATNVTEQMEIEGDMEQIARNVILEEPIPPNMTKDQQIGFRYVIRRINNKFNTKLADNPFEVTFIHVDLEWEKVFSQRKSLKE